MNEGNKLYIRMTVAEFKDWLAKNEVADDTVLSIGLSTGRQTAMFSMDTDTDDKGNSILKIVGEII